MRRFDTIADLRSPLTTLSMAMDYFQAASLPEPARKRADLAAGETRRISRLLDEMLLYAKPLQLHMVQIELVPFLQGLVSNDDNALAEKSLTLEWRIKAAPSVSVDQDRLKQVWINLLHNAVDAAPPKSRIGVTIDRHVATNAAIFSICNGGAPIEPSQIEHLFDPFFTTKVHGTGLGLGIVRRIVDAHGGEIDVNSDAANGTVFKVTLPLSNSA